MELTERTALMWSDLLASEQRAVSERHMITQRALLYLDAGLPLDKVLDALKISRPTWYRRVRELRDWQAGQALHG